MVWYGWPVNSHWINLVNNGGLSCHSFEHVVLDTISRGGSAGFDPTGAKVDFGDECMPPVDFKQKVLWGLYSHHALKRSLLWPVYFWIMEEMCSWSCSGFLSTYCWCVDTGKFFWLGWHWLMSLYYGWSLLALVLPESVHTSLAFALITTFLKFVHALAAGFR